MRDFVVFIPLTQGYVAKIFARDAPLVGQWKWQASIDHSGKVYARGRIKVDGKPRNVFMHRLILGLTGPKIQGDHRNGDRLDNTRDNLRPATSQENRCNRGAQKNNRLGVKGVYVVRSSRIRVAVKFRGKNTHVGIFALEEKDLATEVHDAWAMELQSKGFVWTHDPMSEERAAELRKQYPLPDYYSPSDREWLSAIIRETVLAARAENPGASQRALARGTGLCRNTISWILDQAA